MGKRNSSRVRARRARRGKSSTKTTESIVSLRLSHRLRDLALEIESAYATSVTVTWHFRLRTRTKTDRLRRVRTHVCDPLGQVSEALREDAGVSQETLARLAGMHRTTPSLYERGLRLPTLTYLFLIALVLQIDAEQLVAGARIRLEKFL
jgi:DNA-binding XRE family transcriptional regulator